MAEISPTVRRRRLGLILRGLRERSGLTCEEAGSAVERSASWVSRVETGRVGVRGRDLKDLLDVYDVDDTEVVEELLGLAREGKQRGWWSRYGDTLSGPYATYIGFESEASEVLAYDTLVVPGLLQTEEYARAIFEAAGSSRTGDHVDRRLKIRMARQELLYKPDPVRLWAICDESILYRRIGGEAVLRGQMKHLLELADLANVTVQLLSFADGAYAGMVGAFSILRFPAEPDPDIVYIEGVNGGDVFAEGPDVRWYSLRFDDLRAAALSPADSRLKIAEAHAALA